MTVKKRIPLSEIIEKKFNCSVVEFLEEKMAEGNGTKEIAQMLGCHPSSVCKIAIDNGLSFSKSATQEIKFCYDSALFQSMKLNNVNMLSRAWV